MGLATDGPENKVSLMRDERDLLRLFGGLYTERFSVSSTGTTTTLEYEPYRLPTNTVDNIKLDYLYAPSISGQVIVFGSLGGSGGQVDQRYTPYLGKSDLLWAARSWLKNTGQMPYIARLAGTRATLSIGDWKFCAKYHGAKYNNVVVAYSSGSTFTLTVSGLVPNYPTLTYSGYNVNDLRELLERDFEIGTSPVYIERWGTTLSTFSTYLTGGADGSFSASSVQQFFDGANIPADCSHILFLAPVSSSYMTQVVDLYTQQNVQPRMLLWAAPEYSTTSELYLFQLGSVLPARHPMVGLVLGTVRMELDGRTVDRHSVEAAAQALSQGQNGNITNLSLSAKSFAPYLTASELEQFKLGGIMCVTRHIRADISTHEGVNSARSNTFLFSSKIAEIAAVCYPFVAPFLGTILADGPHPELEGALKQKLAQIQWISIEQVQCVVMRDTMYVSVQGALPDEILTITFTVKNV